MGIPDFELSFVKSEVLCTALSARGSEFERDFLEPVGHVG